MQLKVKDVAEILNVSGKTIYRMIKSETIPCFRVGGQWRFDRKEIKSWLEDMRGMSFKAEAIDRLGYDERISLVELLQRGGIFNSVRSDNKEEAIGACVGLIKSRMPNTDAEGLVASIMEREAICSTAVGNGVAFPHPKTFGKFAEISYISLCRLEKAIPFDSLDNEKIDTLFFIFPRSEKRFLRIQAKLMRLLREEEVLSVIKTNPSPEGILKVFVGKEAEIFGQVSSDT